MMGWLTDDARGWGLEVFRIMFRSSEADPLAGEQCKETNFTDFVQVVLCHLQVLGQ